MPLELTAAFGYVGLTAFASYLVHHVYMAAGVVGARKKYNVQYPTLYASKEDISDDKARTTYNCIQRAHQNSLENLPTFLSMLITAGLKYPVAASIAGGIYLLGRVLYFRGYSTGVPAKRMQGMCMYFGSLTLLVCCAKMGYEAISASLAK